MFAGAEEEDGGRTRLRYPPVLGDTSSEEDAISDTDESARNEAGPSAAAPAAEPPRRSARIRAAIDEGIRALQALTDDDLDRLMLEDSSDDDPDYDPNETSMELDSDASMDAMGRAISDLVDDDSEGDSGDERDTEIVGPEHAEAGSKQLTPIQFVGAGCESNPRAFSADRYSDTDLEDELSSEPDYVAPGSSAKGWPNYQFTRRDAQQWCTRSNSSVMRPRRGQPEHIVKLYKILLWSKFALDLSGTGTGKTLAASVLARAFDHVVVVAPKNVEDSWVDHLTWCGSASKSWTLLSYDILASTRSPKQRFVDFEVHGDGTDAFTSYSPTAEWRSMVHRCRVLVIVDEAHQMKKMRKKTQFTNAVKALLWPIVEDHAASHDSRVLMMSATIHDKREQLFPYMSILNTSGLRLHDDYLELMWDDAAKRSPALDGLRAWLHVHGGSSLSVSPDLQNAIMQRDVTSKGDAANIIEMAWVHLVLRKFCSVMPFPAYPHEQARVSGRFRVLPEEHQRVRKAVEELELVVRRKLELERHRAELVGHGAIDQPRIGTLKYAQKLSQYEEAKLPMVQRIAEHLLASSSPYSKIVISLNRRDSVDVLDQSLTVFLRNLHGDANDAPSRVASFTGTQTAKQQRESREAFNEDTDRVRVLIGTHEAMSVGINLDDTHGTRPRTVLAMPMDEAIEMTQLMGRVYRQTTRSASTFCVVFAEKIENRSEIEQRSMVGESNQMKVGVESDARRALLSDLQPWSESADGPLDGNPRKVLNALNNRG